MTSYYIPRQPKENPDMSEANRAYIYRIITTAIPLLAIAGYAVDSETAQNILLFAAAVLGLGAGGLAAANTTTKP